MYVYEIKVTLCEMPSMTIKVILYLMKKFIDKNWVINVLERISLKS